MGSKENDVGVKEIKLQINTANENRLRGNRNNTRRNVNACRVDGLVNVKENLLETVSRIY